MAARRESPTLAEWWQLDGVPYRVIAERIGVVHQRAAGIAAERGFRRGQGKRSSRWTHGPCLGDWCRGKLTPVPVDRLDDARRCATCRLRAR